jgi:hypothetical protein
MHEIMNKKFYLGPKFGTLFNKKWITISELLQYCGGRKEEFRAYSQGEVDT